MSAPLWMPGAIRIPSTRRIGLNNNGFRLLTWHTFECPYSWTVEQALRFLINQATEAFVFHPITGQWGQCQPMNTGARTLRASGAATNAFGTVHQQVEVIGYASRPFTRDLTPAGKEGLARGLDFFRSWGIPDQWAWPNQPPPAYPGGAVRRRAPERSGHAYHSGWHGGNTHGDPGAITAPWIAAATPRPAPPPPPDVTAPAGSRWEVTAAELNARATPDSRQDPIGAAPRGTVITATGQTSGLWLQGQTPWQAQHGIRAWWHSGYLKPWTAPAPDATIRRVQELLADIGIDPGPIDGLNGDRTQAAIATYSTTYGYTGSPTAWATLLTHLESTIMSITDQLVAIRTEQERQATVLARVDRRVHDYQSKNEKALADLPEKTTTALLGRTVRGFPMEWWIRMGSLGKDTGHRQYPADPGSPVDLLHQIAAKVLGRRIVPYDGTQVRDEQQEG